MSLDTFLQILILTTGVMGQMLVAHMRKEGFYCWIASNLALIYISIGGQMWGMTVLYIFYTGMCFYSVNRWKKMVRNISQ
jgi:nicotinamide riboside transporter PnuC